MIHDDLDAFENKIEEMALDVGVAFDNMTAGKSGNIDLLYVTSIGFLFVLTVALVSALYVYKQCKSLLFLTGCFCASVEVASKRWE